MYPDQNQETQFGAFQQLFAPRPTPPQTSLTGPPPFHIRESWERPTAIIEPDDGDLDDDDDEDYDDDFDDEDDFDDVDYANADDYDAHGVERLPRGRSAPRGRRRSPGDPPLGSYESRQAALRDAGRRKPKQRRGTFRAMVPLLLLVGMGVGAIKLLGPPAAELPIQHEQTPPSSSANSPVSSAAGTTAVTSFAAYSGQQQRDGGELAINSLAAANGMHLAVGSADGYPAIWRQGSGSSWSLTDTSASGPLAGRSGDQTLVTLTNGPRGWLAVGDVVSGASQHPVVVTSTDGRTWQAADGAPAFSGAGLYTFGAAAGRIDYVIVGEQVTGKTATAATWWSAGLGGWNQGVSDGVDGKPSEMFAVTVTPERFIAAGAIGSQPAVWASSSGQEWTPKDLALPQGATKAALRQVADNGQLVVATGNAETQSGTVAFAEVSSDGGINWHEVSLPAQGSQAAVDALVASSGGFAAMGQSGQSSASSAVVWTSTDGMSWTPAKSIPAPTGGKVRIISGLASAGTTMTGIGVATFKAGARPVIYSAPTP